MPGQRAKRTSEELSYSQAFVRQIAEMGRLSDHYQLAAAADLSPATVNGYWYGQSVPDGFQMLKLLKVAGIVNDDFRFTRRVAQAAAREAHLRAAKSLQSPQERPDREETET